VRDIGPEGLFFEVPSDCGGLVRDRLIDHATILHETGEIRGNLVVRHVTKGIDVPRGCGVSFDPATDRDLEAMNDFLRGLDADHAPAGDPGIDDDEVDEKLLPTRPGERRVRIQTIHGAIEGSLAVGEGASAMHRLNVVAATQKFLRLEPPIVCTPDCVFRDGPLSIVIDSIVFVTEAAECVPVPKEPLAAARFRRARMILLLKDYLVEGFVHVAPGGDPIVRLNQDRHKFIALTSVLVRTADNEFSVPFMALNCSELLAIQEIEVEESLEVPAAAAV
jgi:hypothetical protein